MSVTVKCQKCGAENRLGQLFCRECGTKLDLSKLTPQDVSRQQDSIGFAGWLARIFRYAISLSLVAILGLLCWSAPVTGDASSADGAQIIRAKFTALRGAVLSRKDLQETFNEADLNAYLNAVLTGGTKSPGGLKMVLEEIRLDIHPSRTPVWMKASLGPLPVTYSTDVTVSRNAGGHFTFTAGIVRIGRLPVPGPIRTRVLRQMSSTFQNLQEESTLFSRLTNVEVGEGEIKVATISK